MKAASTNARAATNDETVQEFDMSGAKKKYLASFPAGETIQERSNAAARTAEDRIGSEPDKTPRFVAPTCSGRYPG
jgi:hypothetical protein